MSYFWLVLLWVASLTLAIGLAMRSGDAYSPHDAEEHATAYGDGAIREAHGPVTPFLWVFYAGTLVFTVVYSIVRWNDIVEMFHMMGL